MKTLPFVIGIIFATAFPALAQAVTAPGTFTETYPVTTTTTVNGTVSCVLDTTSTILTCTFSQTVQPNATITISIPSGL